MNTLAVLIGIVAVNILAVFFYQEIGSNTMGLFFLLLNLLFLPFLMGAVRDDLSRGRKGDNE